jgi:hypothetical protein
MSLLSVYDDVVIVGEEGALRGRTSTSLTLTGLLLPLKCILGRRDKSPEVNSVAHECTGQSGQ